MALRGGKFETDTYVYVFCVSADTSSCINSTVGSGGLVSSVTGA